MIHKSTFKKVEPKSLIFNDTKIFTKNIIFGSTFLKVELTICSKIL